MSSTSVHSEPKDNSDNNVHITGAVMTPTEEGVRIPPESAERGPSKLDVLSGGMIEIPVEESTLTKKDGSIVDKEGRKVAQISEKDVKKVEENNKNRKSPKNQELGGR